jgi:hypothetical protein
MSMPDLIDPTSDRPVYRTPVCLKLVSLLWSAS